MNVENRKVGSDDIPELEDTQIYNASIQDEVYDHQED
jgi:hypothetical protein